MGTGSPDLCSVAAHDYDKFAHQICDLIATVPARVWDSTLGPNSIELKRLLAKRYTSVCLSVCACVPVDFVADRTFLSFLPLKGKIKGF